MTGPVCSAALKALAEETRLHILRLLLKEQLNVTEISERLQGFTVQYVETSASDARSSIARYRETRPTEALPGRRKTQMGDVGQQ
jgi:predicted transcriptional regulator